MVKLEVCVDSADGLAEAVTGGAARIELCSALELGGLTPAPGLMGLAAGCDLPVVAMIRPRPDDFVYSPADLRAALADIAAVRAMGLAGVVIGANLADGSLDRAALATLVAEAAGLEVVLHRAVDLAPDPVAAVEMAADLGIVRILSSGGALRAADGLDRLAAMIDAARGRLTILPGSGITPENVAGIVARLKVGEVHASCAGMLDQSPDAVAMGFATAARRQTDAAQVRRMVGVLSGLQAA